MIRIFCRALSLHLSCVSAKDMAGGFVNFLRFLRQTLKPFFSGISQGRVREY